MKLRPISLVAALLLVLATTIAAARPAAAGDPMRPFAGARVSADGYDFGATGCPAGAFLRFRTDGHGRFTHLGTATVTLTHCTWVDPATNSGWFDDGPMTLVAADGSTLVLRHQGTFTLVPNPGAGPPYLSATTTLAWHVTDGTGRFEHATGSGTGVSFDDMLTGMQAFRLTGSIGF